MSNKPWKAQYWPQIAEEVEKKRVENKQNSYYNLYIYDYTRNIYSVLKRKTDDRNSESNKTYFYITKKETMQSVIDNWHLFNPRVQLDLRRRMKQHETEHLHKVMYEARKEVFDALVAETNS